MTPFSADPFAYIFSVVVIAAVLVYIAYGTVDRVGLRVRRNQAIVTGKRYNPPGTAYDTTIAGDRAWTRSHQTAETHVVMLQVGEAQTVGVVSKPLFDTLAAGDRVTVKLRQTRITRRLEAIEVAA